MTNEQRDAAWTAADAAREAALRVPAVPAADPDMLGKLTDEATLIFRGTVQYQTFEYDANGIPFTHTTFAVTDKLKGGISGDQFTLIQEGGPGQNEGDPAMMSSNSRHFNVGEEELLLLGTEYGNGVRDVQIRFRIYDGKVYDEDGRGVFIEAISGGKGHILRLSADRNPDARFSEIRVGSHVLYKHFGGVDKDPQTDEGADSAGVPDAVARRSYSDSASVGALIAAIKQ